MYESSSLPIHGQWRIENYYHGSPTVYDARSENLSFLSFREGVDNPFWRIQIARGESATTTFNAQKIEVVRWSAGSSTVERNWTVQAPFYKAYIEGQLGFVYTFPGGASQGLALNKAKEALVRKARDYMTPLQLGVTMGELAQTLRMIRHPLLGLRRGFDTYYAKAKKLRQRLYVSNTQRRKALAGAYLEESYGWEPLVADIEGGLTALDQYFKDRPFEIKRFTGFGNDLVTTRQKTIWNGGIYAGWITSDWRLSDKQSARVRAGIKIKSEGSEAPINKLQGLLGLKLRDFAPTVYELLPWSFLVDYFSNLGSLIDACSYLQGNVAWICYNSKRVQDRILLGQTVEADDGFVNPTVEHISPCYFHLRKKTIARTPLGSIVPDFRLQLPGLATRKALNIGALLLQR